jgi:hypothetical protein
MEKIKHLKIETVTHISFLNLRACKGTCLTHACISFFARTDVDAGGATDNLVQSVRWVEPGCRGDRPGLPLTIGSPGLPLYLPYIYIYISFGKMNFIEPVIFGFLWFSRADSPRLRPGSPCLVSDSALLSFEQPIEVWFST